MSLSDKGKPNPAPVRLLIVDDSALIRKILLDLLGSTPEIEVVGIARDGVEALELNVSLAPDVITLDIEMPGMSGLEALPLLLRARSVSIIMVSALTQEGAEATLTALELGSVDFLPKPDRHQIAQIKALGDILIAKVLSAARCRGRAPLTRRMTPPGSKEHAVVAGTPGSREHTVSLVPVVKGPITPCILIGISTGGPQALSLVLPALTPPVPPILIVQHMPAKFTYVFAERLARQCASSVREAQHNERVLPDTILIAPGGRHMTLISAAGQARVALSDGPLVSGHKPSVDMLFQSGARTYRSDAVGIIMTGMGRDGVEGCKKILDAGGRTFGQDEQSSVVYGMNKLAYEEQAVQSQFALADLPALIQRLTRHE